MVDIQRKKGILEICILAAILKTDSYGYKIIVDISSIITISESTLYPILKRLEQQSALKTYSVEHNGRLRKYYSITSIGKNMIKEYLDEWNQTEKIYQFVKKEVNDEKGNI